MRLDATTCRRLLANQPVVRLATIGPNGPHVVPMVFAIDSSTIVSIVDQKPKTTSRLQRLANLETDPRASVLADHYDDDWSQLWWVRADVIGRVAAAADEVESAAALLRDRYPHYATHPPGGPAVILEVQRWSGWAAGTSAIPAV